MKKRGISAVVATILIILIVVVGVGIVWKVIMPLFAELEFLSYSDVQLKIVRQGFTVYDPEQHFAFVQIERGKDEVNMTGIEIGFNFGGTTKTYQSMNVPTPNGKYTYKFNFTNDSDMGIPQDVIPDKVTVAPIFRINNKERLGKILDSEDMPVGRIHLSAEAWERANNDSAIPIVVATGSGDGNEPGKEVEPVEPVCAVIEICGNGIDDDCENGVDDGCDVLGYFFAGDGSSGSPYIIENCYQLQNMSYKLDGYYELKGNINCSMTNTWDDGNGFNPIGNASDNGFIGIFDGRGHTIANMYINRPSTNTVGVFGYIRGGAEVRNVGLENANVVARRNSGTLVGSSSGATVSRSWATGSISGSYSGQMRLGGLIGISSDANSFVDQCFADVTVTATGGAHQVGGLAGYNGHGSVMTNCYATGNVSGYWKIGGLVGDNPYPEGGYIQYSYSTGKVTGIGGGLVGFNYQGGVTKDSYWDVQTSGETSSNGGVGKTTEDMMKQETFVDWNFTTIWNIDEGNDYPYFR